LQTVSYPYPYVALPRIKAVATTSHYNSFFDPIPIRSAHHRSYLSVCWVFFALINALKHKTTVVTQKIYNIANHSPIKHLFALLGKDIAIAYLSREEVNLLIVFTL